MIEKFLKRLIDLVFGEKYTLVLQKSMGTEKDEICHIRLHHGSQVDAFRSVVEQVIKELNRFDGRDGFSVRSEIWRMRNGTTISMGWFATVYIDWQVTGYELHAG